MKMIISFRFEGKKNESIYLIETPCSWMIHIEMFFGEVILKKKKTENEENYCSHKLFKLIVPLNSPF